MSTPSRHVNIDGDVVMYSVGFASQTTMYVVDGKRFEEKPDAIDYCTRYNIDVDTIEKDYVAEPIAFALSSVKRLIARIVKSSKASTKTILLTGEDNFRDEVAKFQPYKGNRVNDDGTPKQPKPIHFQAIKDYLLFTMGAEMIEGEEADDQLSVRAVESGHTIATIDKDLNNTTGWHYNWQKDDLYFVEPIEADRNFYKQLLTGDATDHIPGLFKFTGIRASKKFKDAIDEMTEPYEMYKHVKNIYMDGFKKVDQKRSAKPLKWNNVAMTKLAYRADDTLTEIGRLLWMRRADNEMWKAPTC